MWKRPIKWGRGRIRMTKLYLVGRLLLSDFSNTIRFAIRPYFLFLSHDLTYKKYTLLHVHRHDACCM
jgi:hypothetical protein